MPKPRNPKAVGELTEAMILAHLTRKGWAVSIPFGNNQRYDMIVDDGTTMRRAQCKTGTFRNGCVIFPCVSRNGFTGARYGYQGQIECFIVWCPQVNDFFLVPLEEATNNEMALRINPPRGGSKSNIRWADQYRI